MSRFNSLSTLLKSFVLPCALLVTGLAGRAQAQLASNTTATSQATVINGLGNATGVAVDPLGNLYVTDNVNNLLQQVIGANGAANTFLTGLSTPGQVAIDSSRNVYLAGGTTNSVLKYTSSNGALSLNSPATVGTGLGNVVGVAVDLAGSVYIVDATNKQVVKVTAAGVQTTIASKLVSPTQVAVDRLGNVFVADPGANAVVYLQAGITNPSTIGTGLNAPSGVAVDTNNNLFIADTGNNVVKEVPNVGGVPTAANQTTLAVVLSKPTTIAVDSRNTLYVGGSNSVVHFSMVAPYFGLVQAKTTSAVLPVTINFNAATAVSGIKVVTTGITGLDYNDAGGGTCAAGTTYQPGQSCIVNVTFTPQYPGPRSGGIVLYDSANKIVSRTFLGGGGLGPQITFDPSVTGKTVPLVPPVTVKSVNPNYFKNPVSLLFPHGVHLDAANNKYFADTNNDRVVVIPADGSAATYVPLGTESLNDANINGVGDLVVPDLTGGRFTIIPNENGASAIPNWNYSDLIALGSGYGRLRVVGVDIAGGMFFCDATANKVFAYPFFGTPQQLAPGATKGCLGAAVDLYGNVGVSDAAGNNALYIPISGQAPYAVGTGFNSPWGVAFDTSGSLYIGSTGNGNAYKIPNEFGVLASSDLQILSGNKAWGLALDNDLNIYSVPSVGSAPLTGFAYLVLDRAAPITVPLGPQAPAGTLAVLTVSTNFTPSPTTVAVGANATPVAFTVSNSGNQSPVPVYPSGLALLGALDDFPIGNSSTLTPVPPATTPPTPITVAVSPSSPVCNFNSILASGLSCYFSAGFVPQSPGVRTATILYPSQSVTTPQLTLTGTGTGTAPTTDAGLIIAQSAPSGTPGPFQALAFTATVNSAATGSITLYVDGLGLPATEVAAGVATFSLPAGLAAGPHTITATYSGDKTYATTATPVSLKLTVSSANAVLSIVSSALFANVGQPVTITASLGGGTGLATPTGTVTFLDGTTTIGTATASNGVASLTTSALALGAHQLGFTYQGDSIYAMGSSTKLTVTIGTYVNTAVALGVTPVQPAGGYTYGAALTFVATVTPASGTAVPTGSVQFSLDGAVQMVALAGNKASFTVTPNAQNHVLIASYQGDTTFATSFSSNTFVTNKINTATTIQASSTAFAAGSNVTLTATVNVGFGTPSGTVTFRNKAVILGTATLTKGVASLITSAIPGGIAQVTAEYNGDRNDNGSASAPVTITAALNSTSLVVTSSTLIVYYSTVPNTLTGSLTVTVPPGVVIQPSGTVIFSIAGKVIGTGQLSAGSSPSANYTLTTAQLTPGVNTVTATYTGDPDYLASTTTTSLSFYVVPATGYDGDFSVAATPNPLNISIGTLATGTITVTPIAKYFGYVQLTCAGLPQYTSCVMQPDQVLLDGTGTPQTAALTVLSQLPILVGALSPKEEGFRLAGLFCAPLLMAMVLGSFKRGRKLLRSASMKGILALLLLCGGLGSMTACGGHPPIATIAGTYTVTITASGSGGVSSATGLPAPIVHTYQTQMIFK